MSLPRSGKFVSKLYPLSHGRGGKPYSAILTPTVGVALSEAKTVLTDSDTAISEVPSSPALPLFFFISIILLIMFFKKYIYIYD